MPWDGAGNFNRTDGTRTGSNTWTQAKNASVKILSVDHDTHDEDLATGLENCMTRDGQNAATADIPMGGFKHTNVALSAARTDYARTSQIQDNSFVYSTTTGTNTIVASLSPVITAYTAGMRVSLRIGFANTGSATLNLNSVGAVTIKRYGPGDGTFINLVQSDLIPGMIAEFIYDGTNWLLLNPILHLQNSQYMWGGLVGGTVNALTMSLEPDLLGYNGGLTVRAIIAGTNTSTVTLNIDSVGAAAVKKIAGPTLATTDLDPGDLVTNQVAEFVYDGTTFVLMNPAITDILTWTPTFGSQAGTWSATADTAVYWSQGKKVFFVIQAGATQSGSTSTYVTFTLPVTAANAHYGGGCKVLLASATGAGYWYADSTTVARCAPHGSSIGASVGFQMTINGWYEAA